MKNVLIFLGNGYTFDNFHEFIIRDLNGKCNVYLIVEQGYLSESVVKQVEHLKELDLIKEYYLTNFHKSPSIFQQYKSCFSFLEAIKKTKIDLYLVGEEGSIILCFMMQYFRAKGVIIVAAEIILRPVLFRDYFRANDTFIPKWSRNKQTSIDRGYWHHVTTRIIGKLREKSLREILLGIANRTVASKHMILQKWRAFLGYRIIPTFKIGRYIKPPGVYLIGDYCDYLIVNDVVEYESSKLLLRKTKGVFLARHPAYGCYEHSRGREKNKILVLLGGDIKYDWVIQRWTEIIEDASRLVMPLEIHLRFHPRDTKLVRKAFQDALDRKFIRYVVIDSVRTGLREGFCQYVGVISTISSSLRFFKAVASNIFIIGVADIVDGLYSEPSALGSTEGIRWLRSGQRLTREMLSPQMHIKDDHPTYADVLLEILK